MDFTLAIDSYLPSASVPASMQVTPGHSDSIPRTYHLLVLNNTQLADVRFDGIEEYIAADVLGILQRQ
jgi:hypothetical protein